MYDSARTHVLLIEDDEGHAELIRRSFEDHEGQFEVVTCQGLSAARAAIGEGLPDIVISDMRLPDGSGLDLLGDLEGDEFPLVVMTGQGDERMAVEAMKAGALDYVVKSSDAFHAMPRIVKRVLREWRNVVDRRKAEESLRRSERELWIRNRLAQIFLTAREDEVFNSVLEVVLEAMESRYGYFGYINANGDLVSPTLTRDVWENCQVPSKDIVFPKSHWGGLWGRSLKEEASLHSNEPLRVPEGHIALENAAVAPVTHHGRLIGQFAVANRKGGYDAGDLELLDTIANYVAPILDATLEKERETRERERAEEELRESEFRYRALFNNAADAIFIQDLDGQIIEANSVACERLGYRRGELVGLSPEDFVTAEYAELARSRRELLFEKGSLFSQSEHVRRDGSVVPVELNSRVIEYQGRPAVLSVARDVTERREAEKALRESLQTSEDIVDAMPSGLLIFKRLRSGKLVLAYCNPEAERLLGAGIEDLYNKRVEDIWPEADKLGLLELFDDTSRTGAIHETETHLYGGDGAEGSFRFRSFRMPRGRVGVALENLTERHRLAAVVESIRAGVVHLDREHQAIYMNAQALEILGAGGEPMGGPLGRYLDQEEADNILADLGLLSGGEAKALPARRLNVEGHYLECSCLPLRNDGGEYRGALLIVRDVTKDLMDQELLIQQEKLASFSLMVAGIAHDLNNPIDGLQNCIRRIREKPDNKKQMADYLDLMDDALGRMSGVIRQLVMLSKRDSIEYARVNVADALAGAVHFAAKGSHRAEIDIGLAVEGSEGLWTEGDITALFNVFLNVLLNAFAAMEGKGKIDVRAFESGGRVVVEIADNGPGIGPEVRQKIFDPFFTTKAAGKGTGLGLSIARRTVEQHRGTIEAESEPGAGALFRVTLPGAPAAGPNGD